jgi:peptide/nickel transport system substrate-binding protein
MKGIQGIETHGMMHYNFTFLVNRPPYDNNDVRLGLKHAIDRKHVVKQILRGHGVPANDHPISPVNRFHNKDLPQRTYDPEKAKFHLKKAGKLGETFNLHVSDEGFPGAVDAGMLYQQHAAKAGIKINIVREPADGYWNDVWMKKPWCAVYWGGRITEDWMFTTTYAADAPWNDSKWKHDRFNKLLLAARAELDENKRREMYYEMQQICRDEGPVIVMAFTSYIAAGTDRLAFNKMAANWEFDGWKFSERWWFKS